MENWNVSKSSELYNIANWGDGYFHVNAAGNISVTPERDNRTIDLFQLVSSLDERGIDAPVLVRFDGILRDRVRRINEAFASAIAECSYKGVYKGVYPIKVNQQRHVVDILRQAGRQYSLGLEVGSKPELIAVLAIHDTPNALLLCNGYKDSEYIELALMASRVGRRAIIIIEQAYEADQVLEISKRLGIEAEIGLRMKPSSKGSGRWENSAGEKSKFGLGIPEIVEVIRKLKEAGKDHWVKLLHFHLSSQLTNISSLKRALREACRVYVEVAKSCPSICFFDCGGGLGVDYDGSKSDFHSSMNYSIEEYARDIVDAVGSACDDAGISHPDLVTESGRALVTHHSVLVTRVIDYAPAADASTPISTPPTDHDALVRLYAFYTEVTVKNAHETLNDTIAIKDEILEAFNQGDMSLEERAYADRLVWILLAKLKKISLGMKYIPEDFEKIDEDLRDTFFCNFSVFQSAPDFWAIDQLFPVMPIHRLNEEPARHAVLCDLTCDGDGKIDRFIDLRDVKNYVPLHVPRNGEPYYVAIFLVGSYQEVLGDLHNLFGDTNAVHVDIRADGYQEITHVVEGDTVREVLSLVQYDAPDLIERLRISIEKALQDGTLTNEQSAKLQKRFREALDGYTYLEIDD